MAHDPTAPRNFFLNERHELKPTEKPGGGGHPNIGTVNWTNRSDGLKKGFARVRGAVERSKDPGSRHRFFLTATPAHIPRFREKDGKREDFDEKADFRALRSADLSRLGLDLLAIAEDGRALVHAPAARFSVLERTVANLSEEPERARNRWLALEDIDVPDWKWRVDRDWLEQLASDAADCIVELAPVLTRAEAESVISAVLDGYVKGQGVLAAGTDYSGRSWWRAKIARPTVEMIATAFPSIQLMAPMLPFVVAGPEQSVAFGAELVDASGETSPFEEVINLESKIGVMDRLRAAIVPVRVGLVPAS
jgi:hypothetical protein